jgi:hypothetical protein
MAQPTTASISQSTSVQQAAAAIVRRINEKPTTPTVEEIAALIGKPAGQGAFAPTISGVAEEIARLWDDYDVLDKGETRQDKLLEANRDMPHVRGFERLKDTAHAHLRVLEQVLLQLEPQTNDEMLSLPLLTEDLFQSWAGEAYASQELTTQAESEWDAMTCAFSAMTRWLLHNGAKSPLTKTYFRADYRAPLAEQMLDAVRQAALILTKPAPAGEQS